AVTDPRIQRERNAAYPAIVLGVRGPPRLIAPLLMPVLFACAAPIRSRRVPPGAEKESACPTNLFPRPGKLRSRRMRCLRRDFVLRDGCSNVRRSPTPDS